MLGCLTNVVSENNHARKTHVLHLIIFLLSRVRRTFSRKFRNVENSGDYSVTTKSITIAVYPVYSPSCGKQFARFTKYVNYSPRCTGCHQNNFLYSAQYHRAQCTIHAFEVFRALCMPNHDDKYPTRPGFEPGTSRHKWRHSHKL